MAKHHLVLGPVSGWLAPLPDNARKEIEDRWPTAPFSAIEKEFGYYLLMRSSLEKQPAASDIRKQYEDLCEKVSELLTLASEFERNQLGSFMWQEAAMRDVPSPLRPLVEWLTRTKALLPYVSKYLPDGHAPNARHWLTWQLSSILSDANLTVDARPKGALCYILGVLLEAAGEQPSSPVEIVKPIVAKMKKTPK
jgi:hypothetical protein